MTCAFEKKHPHIKWTNVGLYLIIFHLIKIMDVYLEQLKIKSDVNHSVALLFQVSEFCLLEKELENMI